MKAEPLLKWAGGKRQLLPRLMEHVPERFYAYHEPFVGGGALFFHLWSLGRIRKAHLSDANARLIRTYRGIQRDVEWVVRALRQYAKQHSLEFYRNMRKLNDAGFPDGAVAAWFIYLNRTCYNGLYRVNRANGFNVPMGDYKKPRICDPEGLQACSAALQTADLWERGFERSAEAVAPGDIWYADPPYVPVSATANFTSYTVDGFDDAAQVRLRDVAAELRKRGVHVILSNSSAPRVRELYAGWTLHEVDAKRNINCKADDRGAVKELIIT